MPRAAICMLLVASCLPCAAFAQADAAAKPAPPGYAIENVSVVDVENGRNRPDCTVLIEGQSIRAIIPAATAKVPDGFERIRGQGRFLIPGLFDCHVHYADPPTYGPLFIAHGVTFVREMGGDTDHVIALRDKLNSGKKLGPEMICTGAIVDGKPPIWPFSEVCDTPDEGRAAVDKLVKAGVNQIKVYSGLKLDVYLAIADQAKRRSIRFVGHVPERVTLDEAMSAGQYTDEHMMGFGAAIAKLAKKPTPTTQDTLHSDALSFQGWKLLSEVPRPTLDDFTRRLRESGMIQCPTLIVHHGVAGISSGEAAKDERMKYVSPPMSSFWHSDQYRMLGAMMSTGLTQMHTMVGEMHRAGVPLIVGTDLANPYVFAGSSVHDEMELFEKCGIPPADVLKAATLLPARVCGVVDRLGTIAENKTASLVLLRADPLQNIANVREVEAVFLRGRYFDRAQLDDLLEQARKAAAGTISPTVDIKVHVPGEIIAHGTYKLTYNKLDAGTEEFAIGRDKDGYHFMDVTLPKGWDVASAVKVDYDAQFKPVSAEWQQIGETKTVAKYAFKDRQVLATATIDGNPAGEQTFDMPDEAIFTGSAVACEFFLHKTVELEPGATRDFQSVFFGLESWKVQSAKSSLRRLDDMTVTRKDGQSVPAHHYRTTQDYTAMGSVVSDTWSDDRGIVIKESLKMPMATVLWDLE